MTKSPNQIADELARKCAKDHYDDFCAPNNELHRAELVYQIKQSILLVELLELRLALLHLHSDATVSDFNEHWQSYINAEKSLNNLTTKLKQLGIEI